MKDSFKICLILGALAIISCNQEDKELSIDNSTEKRLIDSLNCSTLLAKFNEKDGRSWIICNADSQLILKVTCRPDYPIFVDSLKKNSASFVSLHYNYEYEIKDKDVIVTFIRKVVHPSSNWQGQTPGKEFLRSTYPRLDNSN